MRSIFKYTILAVFCGLFAMQSAVFAQDNKSGDESGKPSKVEKTDKTEKPTKKNPNGLATVTLEDLAVDFPEVENWEQGEIQKYPTEDLGFSVNYESEEGGRVTVYVYKGGQPKIPDDIADKVIKNEFNKAKGEIEKAAQLGYYENLKEIKTETITLGGTSGKIKALRTIYNFSARDREFASEIYIFGNKNRFIKIRATRQRDDNETGNKMVGDLLKEIDSYFSN